MTSSSPRVVYLRDDAACRYDLALQSPQHPMKPWRLTAVHGLVRRLGLFDHMRVLTPPPLPADALGDFHFNEYLSDLERTSGNSWDFIPDSHHSGGWIPLAERGNTAQAQAQARATATATAGGATISDTDDGSNLGGGGDAAGKRAAGATNQQQQSSATTSSSKKAQLSKAPACFSPYDCPVVQGGLEFSRIVAGTSLFAAVLLNADAADTVVSWTGGMHHARAGACSGFCYVNDCVLAIRELLRKHERVLYIDIDVHHGDGVEEAFYDTDKVFTLSLHKFCDGFFPGTGHPDDVGADKGRFFNMNVPLRDGVRDEEYVELFAAAFNGVTREFRPEAIVLQCGADSLAGDRLGGNALRLSSEGHAACVRIVRDYCTTTKPTTTKLMALGGGGYSVRHVARLWAYETAVLCGLDDKMHSRTVVPLPARRAFPSSSSADEKSPAELLNRLFLPGLLAGDAGDLQIELEERALMLVFADELLVGVSNGGGGGNDVSEDVASSDVSSPAASLPPTLCLFVPSDGGGFEGRPGLTLHGHTSTLFRFVQSVLRQINEHVVQLKDAMRRNGTF